MNISNISIQTHRNKQNYFSQNITPSHILIFDLIVIFQPFYICALVSIPTTIYTSSIFEDMGTIWIAIKDAGTFGRQCNHF